MKTEQLGGLTARIVDHGEGAGPVVVLLHGFGAPGYDLVSLAEEIDAPLGTTFIFPEAPIVLPMEMYEGRAWWMIDMERLQMAIVSGQIRDLSSEVPEGSKEANQLVNGMLDEIERRYKGRPLVLGGFSQGAMLSTDVALRGDRKLAGLMIMSGTLLAEAEWAPLMAARRGLPVIQSHGMLDPILPFMLADRLRTLLTGAGLAHTFIPFRGGHQIPGPALTELSKLLFSLVPRPA
jgi:phospholipase/carboxylesterase